MMCAISIKVIQILSFPSFVGTYNLLLAARRRLILRRLRKAIKEKKLKDLTTYYEAYKSNSPYSNDDIRKEARKIIAHLKAKESKMLFFN